MAFRGIIGRVIGAGAAVAAAATLLIAPGAASAATYINIKHANTPHRCLDANSDGDVYTGDCNGNDNQKWENYASGASGKFKNKKTSQCLAASGTSVFTTTCTSSASDWRSDSGQPRYIWQTDIGKYLNNAGGHGEAVGLRAGRTGTSRWLVVNV